MVLSFYLYKNKSKLNFCTSQQKNKFAAISKIILFVIIVIVLARCLCCVNIFGFNKDFNTSIILNDEKKVYADAMCQVGLAIIDLTLFTGTNLIYFFLWIRQRIFYVDSQFKMFDNQCLRFISFGSIVAMLLWELVILTCYIIFVRYQFNSFISLCRIVPDLEIIFWLQTVTILFGVRTLVMELLLLALFIFPLKSIKPGEKTTT